MNGASNIPPANLAEATRNCLNASGVEVLKSPDVFAGMILRGFGGNPPLEASVLAHHCDEELLRPFATALLGASTSVADLQNAALQTTNILKGRRVDEGIANAIGGQLMAGIVQYLGLGGQGAPSGQQPPHVPQGGTVGPVPPPANVTSGAQGNGVDAKQGKSASKLPLIGGIVGAVIVVAILVVTLVIPRFRDRVHLYDSNGKKHVDEYVEGWKGGTVKLPGPIAERENSEFKGWAPSGGSNDESVLPPDTEVKIDDCNMYRAVWNPKITFDGNGADGGSMDPVTVEQGKEYKLPKCEYTRKGYVFFGWSKSKEGDEHPSSVGTKGSAFEPITYYATWAPRLKIEEVSITGAGDKSGTFKDWDVAMGGAVIRVKNDSKKPARITVDLSLLSESGSKLIDSGGFGACIAPGDSILANAFVGDKKEAKKVTYSIKAEEARWGEPLSGKIKQEVVSQNEEGVTIKVTNTSNNKVTISGAWVVAKDKEGVCFVGRESVFTELAKDQSAEITIDSSGGYVANQTIPDWDKVECEYYVDGYAS